jgi:hypothetical protein
MKPYALERNFVRFTRTNIILYPPVVQRFGLEPRASVFIIWDVAGQSWIFFTPAGSHSKQKLHMINPNGTLYCANFFTPAAKRGDYAVTQVRLMHWPDAPQQGEYFNVYKLKRITNEKQQNPAGEPARTEHPITLDRKDKMRAKAN